MVIQTINRIQNKFLFVLYACTVYFYYVYIYKYTHMHVYISEKYVMFMNNMYL